MNPSAPLQPDHPRNPARQLLLSSDYLTQYFRKPDLGPKIVSEAQFSTFDVPQIGEVRTKRGAESIKLDYVMVEKKFQKNSPSRFFVISPQRATVNRDIYPDMVFLSTLYLPTFGRKAPAARK